MPLVANEEIAAKKYCGFCFSLNHNIVPYAPNIKTRVQDKTKSGGRHPHPVLTTQWHYTDDVKSKVDVSATLVLS